MEGFFVVVVRLIWGILLAFKHEGPPTLPHPAPLQYIGQPGTMENSASQSASRFPVVDYFNLRDRANYQ